MKLQDESTLEINQNIPNHLTINHTKVINWTFVFNLKNLEYLQVDLSSTIRRLEEICFQLLKHNYICLHITFDHIYDVKIYFYLEKTEEDIK